jgi:methylglyoxal synthase
VSGVARRPVVALIAHGRLKPAMVAWASRHRVELSACDVVCTATTGGLAAQQCPDLQVLTVKSGPLGGDQQIGAMIAEGRMDAMIFFADPLTPMPHDVDVKALLRIALVYDLPCAFSARMADILVAGGGLPRAQDIAA